MTNSTSIMTIKNPGNEDGYAYQLPAGIPDHALSVHTRDGTIKEARPGNWLVWDDFGMGVYTEVEFWNAFYIDRLGEREVLRLVPF